MATGKLTNAEKYAIKGMLAEGKSIQDIAEELSRTEATVSKYVSGELDGIVETIVQARLAVETTKEVVEETPLEPEKEAVKISDAMMVETVHKLKQAGFNRDDAKEMIKRVLRKLDFEPDNAQQLYAICVRFINSQDLMIKRAAGGRTGVAAMTQAASERIDEFHKNQPSQGTRKVRECVFQPKDNKMLSDG